MVPLEQIVESLPSGNDDPRLMFMYRIYSRISRSRPLKIESVCGPKSLTRV